MGAVRWWVRWRAVVACRLGLSRGRWGTLIGSCPSLALRANSFLDLANQSPPPPFAGGHLAAIQKRLPFFKVVLASSGHRGRDDARGHRSGGAPGLTRTSGQPAVVPSPDGRSAAPSALRGLPDTSRAGCQVRSVESGLASRPRDGSARYAASGVRCPVSAARGVARETRSQTRSATPSSATPKASRLVHHEKERRRAGPKFASSPTARDSDGRGHRRGLDGPTMPNPI